MAIIIIFSPAKNPLISDMEGELGANGSMTAVYIFSIIAIFILFLACINLSTLLPHVL
jgi:hypothetical protein